MSESSTPYRPLLLSVSRDLWLLCVQTMALARAETRTSVGSTVFYLAVAAGGVVVAIGGLLILLSALVLIAIALGLPAWAAASLAGILLVGAGAGTVYFCVTSLLEVEFTMPRTRRSIKDTVVWLKAQTR